MKSLLTVLGFVGGVLVLAFLEGSAFGQIAPGGYLQTEAVAESSGWCNGGGSGYVRPRWVGWGIDSSGYLGGGMCAQWSLQGGENGLWTEWGVYGVGYTIASIAIRVRGGPDEGSGYGHVSVTGSSGCEMGRFFPLGYTPGNGLPTNSECYWEPFPVSVDETGGVHGTFEMQWWQASYQWGGWVAGGIVTVTLVGSGYSDHEATSQPVVDETNEDDVNGSVIDTGGDLSGLSPGDWLGAMKPGDQWQDYKWNFRFPHPAWQGSSAETFGQNDQDFHVGLNLIGTEMGGGTPGVDGAISACSSVLTAFDDYVWLLRVCLQVAMGFIFIKRVIHTIARY